MTRRNDHKKHTPDSQAWVVTAVEQGKRLLLDGLTVRQVAQAVGLTRAVFERRFTSHVGVKPAAWRRLQGIDATGKSKMVAFRLREHDMLVEKARSHGLTPNEYARAVLQADLLDVKGPRRPARSAARARRRKVAQRSDMTFSSSRPDDS